MQSVYNRCIRLCLAFFFLGGCSQSENDKSKVLFELIPPEKSGVKFVNQLTFDNAFNIYTYRNYYNGGGVALGDINNDGLLDIYLTANMKSNKLFLNKGNWQFEDITDKAGVAGTKGWSTGVSMADVNGDGWLDIYVCNSGDIKGDNRENELFINNGDLTFTEKAKAYNVTDGGYTTHAAFFDYDRDGDLDLYILNNSYTAIGSFNLMKNERDKRDHLGGDKLMRNDGDHFTDVSVEAGIYGSVIGFGLGVTVGDFNKDNWPDIFVSNDFFERDYLYLNTGKGSFRECLELYMKSISATSMGADMADIDNDTYPDLFVTDMLPEQNDRIKTVTTFEDWNRYQYNLKNGYYHQFTRNMFQLNNGDSTFSEIGRLSGVEATDWSWGALIFDMDNDGYKDIFVANGIYQDLTNLDFLQFASSEEVVRSVVSNKTVDYKKLTEIIPSNPISNYAFHNQGELKFVNKATEWGLGDPGFSNGSAYGDLDNDGDLDLVVNRVNMESLVYRNNSNELFPQHHYLKFNLIGIAKNKFAVGAKITLTSGEKKFYLEQMPIRGFESAVDPRPNFGLGDVTFLNSVRVDWPDGRVTLLDSVQADQTLTLRQEEAIVETTTVAQVEPTVLKEVKGKTGIDFIQEENAFVDFDRDRLIFHMSSTEGPRMSKGDVNNDGLEDFYIGGPKDQPGALFIQKPDGSFFRSNEKLFLENALSEDMGSTFFDADNDGDLDLYVCSGGVEFSTSSMALLDRLYLNDGKGNFKRSKQVLPTFSFESTSTVAAADYDGDGDIDLFVGVRVQPHLYGMPTNGYILNNDGKGNFTQVTKDVAPDLKAIGMITDAIWDDVDQDNDPDLILIGEYMPITIFINDGGKLSNKTSAWGLDKSNGWWNRIKKVDIDLDGDMDFVVGNHGLNSRFRATPDKPVCVYINDFDQNGTVEQILCTYNGDKSYPMVLRHDLIAQLPSLKKKYLKFENYKDQTIADVFTPEQLANALTLNAYELASVVLINEGNKFTMKRLPQEAQLSPVYGIETGDFDHDNYPDILLGGNLYSVKPEAGRYDASYGTFLKGDGKGAFHAQPWQVSGFRVQGEVRDIITLQCQGEERIIIGRNNDSIITYRVSNFKK